MYDDDQDEASADRFGDALLIISAAMNAKAVAAKAKHLRKLEADIRAAEERLGRLQAQSGSIVEAAEIRAAQILKEAEAEARSILDDAEGDVSARRYSERLGAKLGAGMDQRRAAIEIAEEDAAGGRSVNVDIGDERSDHAGNPFVGGTTLTRDLSHKAAS